MKIQIKKGDGGVDLIELEGELDFHSSPEVRSELAKLVERQAPKVMVDLKSVNYIDSSGLATFVELFQKMKRYNGTLVLFNLTQGVRGVFEIAKLDTIFKLAATQKDALALIA